MDTPPSQSAGQVYPADTQHLWPVLGGICTAKKPDKTLFSLPLSLRGGGITKLYQ